MLWESKLPSLIGILSVGSKGREREKLSRTLVVMALGPKPR